MGEEKGTREGVPNKVKGFAMAPAPWSDMMRDGHPSIDRLIASLPDQLKMHRDMRKLTQAELATLSGLKEHQIVDIERGKTQMSIPQLLKLSKGLHVHPAHLLGILEWDEARILAVYENQDEAHRDQMSDAVMGMFSLKLTQRYDVDELFGVADR